VLRELPPRGRPYKPWQLTKRFTTVAVLVGLFGGVVEGLLLFLTQHPEKFPVHRVGPAVLVLAPLVDALAFGFLGGILGLLADFSSRSHPRTTWGLATAAPFIAGVYATFVPVRVWFATHDHQKSTVIVIALLGGLVVTITARTAWHYCQPITTPALSQSRGKPLVHVGILLLGAVLLGWSFAHTFVTTPGSPRGKRSYLAVRRQPNLVLISMDTARADHFSSYGYPRPTTPGWDNLAKEGILFETAIAPASWTLPTFATVFTGLLPHQHSADEHTPLANGSLTLASILRARGYETAGFNANFTMGTARTGLAQGFDIYNDDDASLSADLASISSVKIFWWLFYYPFIRPDSLVRRDARELNQPAFRWFRHRSKGPFFLFVNYFDPHEPYHTIPGVGNQFGDANKTLAQRLRAEIDASQMEIDVPQSPAQQAALIAGYDSSVAWADRQTGDLLRLLKASPEWSNIYVILFSDHGQAFGEHGYYGHHWGLHWELLHVPLIIVGPGIPQGQRVTAPVGLQQLFSTVLDLTNDGNIPPRRDSLRCYWTLPAHTCDLHPEIVSEFSAEEMSDFEETPSISLATPGRQFILDSSGNRELYDLTSDPREEVNLATSPDRQSEVEALQHRLFAQVRASSRPWNGGSYLWGFGESDFALLTGETPGHSSWRPPRKAARPSEQNNELLHSIPYE
jgi:arylsulfatase A-like enzyme